MDTRKIFSENLLRLIQDRGIEQQAVASKLDVSTSAVSAWVTGVRFPRADMMQALAEFFHVSVSDLVEMHEKERIEPDSQKLAILFSRSRKLNDQQLDIVNSIVQEMTKEQNNDDE